MRKRRPAFAGEDCKKVEIYVKRGEGFETFGEFVKRWYQNVSCSDMKR